MDASSEGRLLLLEHQLGTLASDMRSTREGMQALVALNERHIALLDRVVDLREVADDHEKRLRIVEVSQPGLKEARTWLISGVSAIASVVLTTLATSSLPTKHPPTLPRDTHEVIEKRPTFTPHPIQ